MKILKNMEKIDRYGGRIQILRGEVSVGERKYILETDTEKTRLNIVNGKNRCRSFFIKNGRVENMGRKSHVIGDWSEKDWEDLHSLLEIGTKSA